MAVTDQDKNDNSRKFLRVMFTNIIKRKKMFDNRIPKVREIKKNARYFLNTYIITIVIVCAAGVFTPNTILFQLMLKHYLYWTDNTQKPWKNKTQLVFTHTHNLYYLCRTHSKSNFCWLGAHRWTWSWIRPGAENLRKKKNGPRRRFRVGPRPTLGVPLSHENPFGNISRRKCQKLQFRRFPGF